MPLPSAPRSRGQVEVAGQMTDVRSLTRAEALAPKALQGQPDAEEVGSIYMISRGCVDLECELVRFPAIDAPEAAAALEEARDWFVTADAMAVQKLTKGIAVVSRLLAPGDGEDGKAPNPTAEDSPPSGPSSKES